jgi:hypothetical protein
LQHPRAPASDVKFKTIARAGVYLSIQPDNLISLRGSFKMSSAKNFISRLHSLAAIYSFAVAMLALSLSTGISRGQSTFGSFVGTVKDPAGAVIPTCVVSLTNKGTSAKREALTDADGNYAFLNIEPGMYDVEFRADGFRSAAITGFELTARQTLRADGTLQVATVVESVNVTAAIEPTIQTEVPNIAETKTGRELIDLPVAIGSRGSGSTSPISTLTTQPGVQTDSNGNISIAGAKPSMISVTLDGISTSSAKTGTPVAELFPSFEGIAEIRVSEISNTAEFGGVSDITTISKGGSNAFHGSLFENYQGSALNARNPFSATKPKLVMNDFGGSIGGPLSIPKLYTGKNRTFFFGDFEGLRLPQYSLVTRSIPTEAMKRGDLSVYLPGTVIKDPLSPGATFAGNQIPITRIAALSQRAMDYYMTVAPNFGASNAIANNYRQNYPTNINSNQGDARIDQNIGSRQTAFARITYKRKEGLVAPSGSPVLGGGESKENDWSIAAAHNFIITPSLLNEVRVGISGQNTGTQYGYTAQGVAQALGLNLPSIPNGAASTNFAITGFSGLSGGSTSKSRSKTTQLLDNLSYSVGKHTFKFGGDLRWQSGLYTNVFSGGRMSSYTFNNSSVTSTTIGNPFASFLLGVPDVSNLTTVQNPDSFGYSVHYAFYAQDNWKITRNLTINYGLRYEYHPNYQDHYLNTANFVPDIDTVVNGTKVHGAVIIPDGGEVNINPAFRDSIAPTPILTASQAGISQNLRYAQRTDFGPRVGFAWRLGTKTVLRGGYGRFIEALSGTGLNSAWAVQSSFVGRYTNSLVNGKPLYSFPNPFPANLAQPGTESFQLASELHYRDPKIDQWNFTIERDLGFSTGLRITYDGSHGHDLGLQYNANQLPANTVGVTAMASQIAHPLFNSIAQTGSGARSNYHALTIAATRRFSKGLQFQSSYAFAKNLSNGGGANPTGFAGQTGGSVSDRFNYDLDYGNVAFTRRHRFQTTFLYAPQVNVSNFILRHAANGWELAGVLMMQTGPFLTVITSGADPAGLGQGQTAGGTVRADYAPGNISPIPVNQGPSQWINSAAFLVPKNNIGRFGNSPIGSVIGPGTQGLSLSLFRSVSFQEKVKLRMGVAAGNLLNHPNYATPALTLGNATFGTITALQSAESAGPRNLMLTGRLTF